MRQAPPSSHAIAAVGWLDAIRIGWVSGANNMLPMIMPEKNTATIVSRRSAARIAQDRASQANQKLLHRSSVRQQGPAGPATLPTGHTPGTPRRNILDISTSD
jgi:hypothetical protein